MPVPTWCSASNCVKPFVDRHGFGETTGLGQTEDGFAFFGEHVGHARHPTFGTNGNAFQHHVVETGEQHETVTDFVAHVDEAAGCPPVP